MRRSLALVLLALGAGAVRAPADEAVINGFRMHYEDHGEAFLVSFAPRALAP